MITLGIETSCDETAVAVTDNKKVLSNIVSSSVQLHSRFGGVVPEIASRHHVEYIGQCLMKALRTASIGFQDIKLVSVTQGPGLMSSLLVGISLAKSISFALNVPVIGVNHLIAHLWAAFLDGAKIKFPFIGFVISGGHTNIIYAKSATALEPLGRTRDDACGESFDKVSKILGLGYPGGPIIEQKAKMGDSGKIKFPRAYLKDSLDFSFSGVKTSVLYYVRDREKEHMPLEASEVRDIAAGFQESVFEVSARKAISACRAKGCSALVVGGGVSANKRLREKLFKEAKPYNVKVYFPSMKFCSDNAAMVAYFGHELFKAGVSSGLDFGAFQYSQL